MNKQADKNTVSSTPFSSNGIRLSATECLITFTIVVVLFASIPRLWGHIEKFEPGDDYRIPYALSDDYWLYSQYSWLSAQKNDVMVIGDSVVWGHYVPPDGSLSHYLNEKTNTHTFANMGIDGIHPAAMSGLIEYYAKAIEGKKVIISFNPLWMTSSKHDLQTTKEFRFNHPRLVPQFVPKIECYTESRSNKIAIMIERNVQLFSWASHIRTSYYNKMDLASWAVENPHECPFCAISLQLPKPQETPDHTESWNAHGENKFDFPWVTLDSSVQWKFFKCAVETLKKRGNTVFVLVGPFNEHMMTDDSLDKYRDIKKGVETWLKENNISYCIPKPLQSELYADASHPIRMGYKTLAQILLDDEAFKSTILNSASEPK
jgi:hypothetical protein